MSALIDRAGLVAALEAAVDKRVTVVSGPAGSGKTSLLRLWAERHGQDRRIAFVSVQPGAELFWFSVLGGLRSACGGEPPYAAPDCDGREKVLAEISGVVGPFVLVVDDAHELDTAEELAALLAALPPRARVIVAARRDLPLGLHKLRLAGELAEIRPDRLRFTIEETAALVAAAGIKLPERVIAVLHARTEGWAAGLRLAVLSLAGHPDPERFVASFSGSDRTVAEYLMAELLERQPADVLRLLLRTSIVDRVSGALADLLTGATGSERILLDLAEANAFVVALDPERTWFRYHRLFAGLLNLELRRTQAAEIPRLHRLAARWFAGHAQRAEAVRHLQAAGDWAEAATLLSGHALTMTLDGEAKTVRALLRAFPAPDDSLALVHAIDALGRMRLDEAAAHLETARSAGADRSAVTAVDLLLARLRGHFDCVVANVDALPAAGADLRAVVLLNAGVTEAWSRRPADGERHLLAAAALARELDRPYLEVAALAHLGFASTNRSFALARRRCEDAIALAAEHGWDAEPVVAPALVTLAWVLAWTGEFDDAHRRLDQARQAADADSEPGIRLLVHVVAALLAAARGDHRAALTEFAAARESQARMADEHVLSAPVAAWTAATRARAGHTAAPVLRPAADGDVFTQLEAHLSTALGRAEVGDRRAAAAALERALDLAEPDGLVLPFAMTGAWRLLEARPAWETRHAALVATILDAVRGRVAAPSVRAPLAELSPSELRVLRYLPTNLTRPEIAGELLVSLNTVNTHIRRIYAKLGATDRGAAVRRGRELRLLSAGTARDGPPVTNRGAVRS
ncbi:LuxR C-terminal-related transcriptional regulator [Amycolatopsis sp. NPDC049691]|uniref:LuxR C-terminal-related transcriptional regulator n=1 Tax=Amycolatopsis sp. NPDC049691 TaxID=3155155 RepID=UPI00343A5DC7